MATRQETEEGRWLYEKWAEEYDGPEGPDLEDVAMVELSHLPDDEWLTTLEEARRIAAIESYEFAFGVKPRLTADGWPCK